MTAAEKHNPAIEYERHRADIASLLDHIGQLVEAHGEGQEAAWGQAAELAHVRGLLVKAARFMAGFEEGAIEAMPDEMRNGQ